MSNIMSVIFICAALVLTFTYTRPTYSGTTGSTDHNTMSIAELKVEKARFEEALEKTREIERVRDGLIAKYNALKTADLDRLNKMLPDGIDTVRLIVDLDNIARSYGLTMHDIVVADPKERMSAEEKQSKPGLYSYVNLNFNVTGTYDQLAAFLSDVDRSLRIMDVADITIAPAQPKPGEELLNLKPSYLMALMLKVYYMN